LWNCCSQFNNLLTFSLPNELNLNEFTCLGTSYDALVYPSTDGSRNVGGYIGQLRTYFINKRKRKQSQQNQKDFKQGQNMIEDDYKLLVLKITTLIALSHPLLCTYFEGKLLFCLRTKT